MLVVTGGGAVHAASNPELDRFYKQSLEWGSCDEYAGGAGLTAAGIECARVTVPIDYDRPDGPTARIAISRLRAGGARVASVLTNPGGPGAAGLAFPRRLAEKSALAQRFDVIGVDVRGLGASTPKVECLTPEESQAQRQDLDIDTSPTGIAQTEWEHADYAAKCVQRTGLELLGHVGTREVAHDFDVIRAVLGDEKLTYFGGSYGSKIGAAIAEMFPNQVRAMVLDAAMDPAADFLDPRYAVAGFQRAFEAYAADCAEHPGCPLGAEATTGLRNLLNPLIKRPAATADPRGLAYPDALEAVTGLLYSEQTWPVLTKGLAELAQGRGDTLLTVADKWADVADTDLHNAVKCLDGFRHNDRAAAAAADRRAREAAPAFFDGPGTGQAPLNFCAFWPVPPTSQPHVPAVSGLPKTVVVATTGDPATAYAGGRNLAEYLGAALITNTGFVHGAALQGNSCIDGPVLTYLIDLVPPADITCGGN
ncbi:alpha/beta hydrolase [Nocardia suismassiliense]|uniref:alpha/beta hydrolase n=1 Tax=Nocardia suismassiliense TaxID=2077092 RepID=UPI001F35AE09|nr:alpha/beta hydrolase [Nocardia suismassiliense]